MRTSTFIYAMAALACVAALLVGCETLLTPDPVTGVTPLAEAGGAVARGVAQNPGVSGLVEGIVGGAAVLAAAFFGRKKIAAGARIACQVVGVVKKKVD
jgi:hypothetical protein